MDRPTWDAAIGPILEAGLLPVDETLCPSKPKRKRGRPRKVTQLYHEPTVDPTAPDPFPDTNGDVHIDQTKGAINPQPIKPVVRIARKYTAQFPRLKKEWREIYWNDFLKVITLPKFDRILTEVYQQAIGGDLHACEILLDRLLPIPKITADNATLIANTYQNILTQGQYAVRESLAIEGLEAIDIEPLEENPASAQEKNVQDPPG